MSRQPATPSTDLAPDVLAETLHPRMVRSYPALLSTEATAMAWARQDAPDGAVVVADYQASPRGRAGLPWVVRPGRGLGATLVLRPELPPAREGWPYVPALLGLLDAVGEPDDTVGEPVATLSWPDTVLSGRGETIASLGVYVELGPDQTRWLTVTFLIEAAAPPRDTLLRDVADAVEHRMAQTADQVLADYVPRCSTLGRQVRARLIPMGADGPEVNGEAVDVLADGALVVRTAKGNRVAVPPQNLGLLEPPAPAVSVPERLFGRGPAVTD